MLGLDAGMTWHGDRFDRMLRKHRADNQKAAGEFYKAVVIADISRTQGSYSPPHHSRPGDPPFYITRDLIRSYRVQFDRANLYLVLGSHLDYSVYLEVGTRRMAPRPHLRRNLVDFRDPIARIMCAPM